MVHFDRGRDWGQLLDIVSGRDADAPIGWLLDQPSAWRDGINWGVLDLSGAYRRSFEVALPQVGQVSGPFHVVRLANNSIDEVRRRVPNDTLGHRGRKDDPLWRARRLLISAHERLSERGDAKLRGLLTAGDPRGEVRLAWHAKETLRGLYDIDCPQLAGAYLGELADDLTDTDCPPELRRLGRTLRRWHDAIVNWHRARVTNGPTEAVNNLIKRVNRVASDSAASPTTTSERCSTPANPTGHSSPPSLPAENRSARNAASRSGLYRRFVTGPRQSGKTVLCRAAFPDLAYANLEAPNEREFALSDPVGFLARFSDGAILDDIQRAPDLLAYLQVVADEQRRNGLFVLTGSEQFRLSDAISQSLAGRTALLRLLPFTLAERARAGAAGGIDDILYSGFSPRIHDQGLDPPQALGDYVETYVERDVRRIGEIRNLGAFGRFLRLCAGQVGQIANLSALGADAGVSHTTARHWLDVLEAGYVVFRLPPFGANIRGRQYRSGQSRGRQHCGGYNGRRPRRPYDDWSREAVLPSTQGKTLRLSYRGRCPECAWSSRCRG